MADNNYDDVFGDKQDAGAPESSTSNYDDVFGASGDYVPPVARKVDELDPEDEVSIWDKIGDAYDNITGTTVTEDEIEELEVKQQEYEDDNAWWERLGQRLTKSYLKIASRGDSFMAQNAAARLPKVEVARNVIMNGRAYAHLPFDQRKMLADKLEPDLQEQLTTNLDELSEKQRTLDLIPQAPVVTAALREGATIWDSIKLLGVDPVAYVAELGVSSSLEAVPVIAGTLATGGVGGALIAGGASGGSAYQADILGQLAEAGVNVRNPEEVIKAFNDEEFFSSVKGEAAAYGAGIGLIDALTAGIASKMLLPARGALANTSAQLGVQTAGGGVGEAVGTVAAGRKIEGKEILAEMAGELVTAPGEVAAGAKAQAQDALAKRRADRIIDEATPKGDTERAPDPATTQTTEDDADVAPPKTADEIVEDAGPLDIDYDGILDGSDTVESSIEPEQQVADEVFENEDGTFVDAEGYEVDAEGNYIYEEEGSFEEGAEVDPVTDRATPDSIDDQIAAQLDEDRAAEDIYDDSVVDDADTADTSPATTEESNDAEISGPRQSGNVPERSEIDGKQRQQQPGESRDRERDDPSQGESQTRGPTGSEDGSPVSAERDEGRYQPEGDAEAGSSGRESSVGQDAAQGGRSVLNPQGDVPSSRKDAVAAVKAAADSQVIERNVVPDAAKYRDADGKITESGKRIPELMRLAKTHGVFHVAESMRNNPAQWGFTDKGDVINRVPEAEAMNLFRHAGKNMETDAVRAQWKKIRAAVKDSPNLKTKGTGTSGNLGVYKFFDKLDAFVPGLQMNVSLKDIPTVADLNRIVMHEMIHRGDHILASIAAEQGRDLYGTYNTFIKRMGGPAGMREYFKEHGYPKQLDIYWRDAAAYGKDIDTNSASQRLPMAELLAYAGSDSINPGAKSVYNKIVDTIVDALRQVFGAEFTDNAVAQYGSPEMFVSMIARQALAATAVVDGNAMAVLGSKYDKGNMESLDAKQLKLLREKAAGNMLNAAAPDAMLYGAPMPYPGPRGTTRLAARKPNAGPAASWQYDNTSQDANWKVWMKNAKRSFVDSLEHLETVIDMIADQGGVVTEKSNARVRESLMHGRIANQMKSLQNEDMQELGARLADRGLKQEELDTYLIALHAPERNAEMNRRFANVTNGSGMSDQQAADIIASLEEQGMIDDLEYAAEVVRSTLAAQRDLMERSGLMAEDVLAEWNDNYENYVPLKGFANQPEDGTPPTDTRQMATGKGLRAPKAIVMKAQGRKTEAASPSTNAMMDMATTIVEAEKNRVMQSFLQLVQDNPNPSVWRVFSNKNPDHTVGTVTKKINGQKVKVRRKVRMHMPGSSDRKYLRVRVEGETFYIKVLDERLANSMNGVGVYKSNAAMRAGQSYTRLISTINTSLNPEFALVNFERDIQVAMTAIAAEQTKAGGALADIDPKTLKTEVAATTAKAGISFGRALMGKAPRPGNQMDAYAQEFIEAGAMTGYYDSKQFDDIKRDIDSMAKNLNQPAINVPRKAFKKVMSAVDIYNSTFENATRLATYAAVRNPERNGALSPVMAANLAKNLTVNFNRRGEATGAMQSLYVFFNASVQGTYQMVRAVGPGAMAVDPTSGKRKLNLAQKIVASQMAFAAGLAAMGRAIMGQDEDGEDLWDKIPDYEKERNFIFANPFYEPGEDDPAARYWRFPMPYGYNMFAVMGYGMEDAAVNGLKGASRSGILLSKTMMGSFSPVGFGAADSIEEFAAKTFFPTFMQPPIDLIANKNFFGGEIYREPYPQDVTPASQMAKQKTVDSIVPYDEFAKFLNAATGGDDQVSGAVDMNPDKIAYLVGELTGAAGNFISKASGTVKKLGSGDDIDLSDIPFAGYYSRPVREQYANRDRYEDNKRVIKQISKQYDHILETDGDEGAFEERYGDRFELLSSLKSAEKQLRKIRKERRKLYNDSDFTDEERRMELEFLASDEQDIINEFNLLYNEATQSE